VRVLAGFTEEKKFCWKAKASIFAAVKKSNYEQS
jgi:hypothetical protein